MTERRRRLSSLRSAFRQLIEDMGGAEQFAKALWPKRDAARGAKRINDWLNPRRREKPDFEDFEHMLFVARARGHHLVANYLAERLCYSRPSPVSPADALAALSQEIQAHQETGVELLERYNRIRAEFERMNAPRPMTQDGGGKR